MHVWSSAILFSAAIGWFAASLPAEQAPCRAVSAVIPLPDLAEASGLAAGRRAPVLWAHNDSGEPILYALDPNGSVKRRVRVEGATVDDWEDIAIGRCPSGTCLYVADIGDNESRRARITIYRVQEPAADADRTPTAEAFHATYPDGPRDAEAFFVAGNGTMFVVSKGSTGPVALYRFPDGARPGQTVRLEQVGGKQSTGKLREPDWITGASVSPDGRWVALRTHHRVVFYRAADLTSGQWKEAARADLETLREPQGEGIAFTSDSGLLAIGEGGKKGAPGSLVRLECRLGS